MRLSRYLVFLLAFMAFPAAARTFYLSPTGSDTNTGLSRKTPWLSPLHSLRCGDVILASPGDYSYVNFGGSKWGQVTCPGNDGVAWLRCETFATCKVVVPDGVKANSMQIGESYWGISGFVASNLQKDIHHALACFVAVPARDHVIHHIIFANDVADTCTQSAFGAGPRWGSNPAVSIDYYVAIGNIGYNSGREQSCGSNFSLFSPMAADSAPGTHIYVAGNLSYLSNNAPARDGVSCWDGNGYIFDTFDGHTTAGLAPYAMQSVLENNLSVRNGGVGFRPEYNNAFGQGITHGSFGHIVVRNNTGWGDSTGMGPGGPFAVGSSTCGELQIFQAFNVTATRNLLVTADPGCYGVSSKRLAPIQVWQGNGTDTVVDNWTYSPFGNENQVERSPGFAYGDNHSGVDPKLAAPALPPAPNCSNFPDVPHCMAGVLAAFRPRNPAAQAYGVQPVQAQADFDPLFPQWLCSTSGLPPGLVSMRCRSGSQKPAAPSRNKAARR